MYLCSYLFLHLYVMQRKVFEMMFTSCQSQIVQIVGFKRLFKHCSLSWSVLILMYYFYNVYSKIMKERTAPVSVQKITCLIECQYGFICPVTPTPKHRNAQMQITKPQGRKATCIYLQQFDSGIPAEPTCVPSQSAVHGASVGRKSDTYRWIEKGIISVSQGGSVFRMTPKQCCLSNFPPKRHVTSWMRNRAEGGQDLSSLGKTW